MVYESLRSSSWFTCMHSVVPMSKPSRPKIGVLMPGATRHSCVFLDFADMLVMDDEPALYDAYGKAWLFPSLQRGTKYPGTAIGAYIKALMPQQGVS